MKNFFTSVQNTIKDVADTLITIVTTPKLWLPFMAFAWMIAQFVGAVFFAKDISISTVIIMGMVLNIYMHENNK